MRVLLAGGDWGYWTPIDSRFETTGHRVFGLVRSAKSSESMLILRWALCLRASPPALAGTLNSSQELFGYRK